MCRSCRFSSILWSPYPSTRACILLHVLSSYSCKCVRLLLHMRQHTTTCESAYCDMCVLHVSSYCYICAVYCYICVPIMLCRCPHTVILLHMRPHTATNVPAYCYTCFCIKLHVSLYFLNVSSFSYICVHMCTHMCRQGGIQPTAGQALSREAARKKGAAGSVGWRMWRARRRCAL